MKPSIDSFEDLAASKETGIVLRSNTPMLVQILVCLKYFKSIQQNIKRFATSS
jgi:hypothetical protein